MGGDKLTILFFFIGTGIAGVMGAMSTIGWRYRALWGVAVICAISAVAYWRYASEGSAGVAVATVVYSIPLLSVAMCVLVVGDREPRRVIPKVLPKPPVLNPGLTADYLYGVVKGATELEAKHKLSAYSDQLARMRGQVVEISIGYGGSPDVHVVGLCPQQPPGKYEYIRMGFGKDQADALAVIKVGNWIEFTGLVAHGGNQGWHLRSCVLEGIVEAPPPPPKARAPRRKASPKA